MNVLVGACGSINVVNLAHYLLEMKNQNWNIKVIMTSSAEKFITAKVVSAATGVEVISNDAYLGSMRPLHMELSDWADIFVVVPATANTLGKICAGIMDDLVSSCALVSKRVLLFPSMNETMWNSSVVKRNLHNARELGLEIVDLKSGQVFNASKSAFIEGVRAASPVEVVKCIKLDSNNSLQR